MITKEEVYKIAKLARLNFNDNEVSDFAHQLTKVMDMIDILNEIDCSNVQPLTSVCDIKQRMRKDEVLASNITDELFHNLPNDTATLAREVKCFIVPKMVE